MVKNSILFSFDLPSQINWDFLIWFTPQEAFKSKDQSENNSDTLFYCPSLILQNDYCTGKYTALQKK